MHIIRRKQLEIDSIYANSIKYASDLIEIKETKCEFPLMTLEDSMINMQILNKWKNALYKI